MRAEVRIWGRVWTTAWRAALANRRGFLTQMTLMIVNDAVWLLFWLLVFRRVGEIRGWQVDDIIVLFATLTTAAGFVLGGLQNSRQIGPITLSGELDAVLALPTAPLPHLLLRRVEVLHVGDALFGLLLFAILGNPTIERTLIFAFGVACASGVLTGFMLALGSTAFFTSRNEAGELGFHSILLFAAYPVDVFTGTTKVLLYVVVPAGFVTAVPARLVAEFDPRWAAASAGAAVVCLTIGVAVFRTGLRRYTSGSLWI